MTPWITVLGFGEAGLDGLAPCLRPLLAGAELLVGAARQLARVPADACAAERLTWQAGQRETFRRIEGWRGRAVTVLASGDPMCFGVGSALLRHFVPDDIAVHPAPSAFSLAAARMRWSLPDSRQLTVHGEPLDALNLHVAPGARLLVLARDGASPARIAALLRARGFGPSRITVLERLGGPDESVVAATADAWEREVVDDLNTVAVDCCAGPDAVTPPLGPGLPDRVFAPGTRPLPRALRALALAHLAPLPGQTLWEAGAGGVGIEWLRCGAGAAHTAEADPARARALGRSAAALGVPGLAVSTAAPPAAVTALPDPPDAVHVDAACGAETIEDAFAAVRPGGRVAVSALGDAAGMLEAARRRRGGVLLRVAWDDEAPGAGAVWVAGAPC